MIGFLIGFHLVGHLVTSVHWTLQMVQNTLLFSDKMTAILMQSAPDHINFKNIEAQVDTLLINS